MSLQLLCLCLRNKCYMLNSFMNRTDIKLMTTAYLTYLCTRHTYINTAHTYIYTVLHMYSFTVQPQLIPAVNCSLACMYCGDLAALCKMQVSTKDGWTIWCCAPQCTAAGEIRPSYIKGCICLLGCCTAKVGESEEDWHRKTACTCQPKGASQC